jgi:ribonuclease P protein component
LLRVGERFLLYETSVSTVETPPETAAWVLEPKLDQERQGHTRQSPPCGAQAFDAGIKLMAQPGAGKLKLPRSHRLIHSGEFLKIKATGSRLVKGCLIVNWSLQPGASHSKIGVVTSRKIGNAVHRARARRLMREVFRQHQHDLSAPVKIVLVARQSIAAKDFHGVERDFLAILKEADLLRR